MEKQTKRELEISPIDAGMEGSVAVDVSTYFDEDDRHDETPPNIFMEVDEPIVSLSGKHEERKHRMFMLRHPRYWREVRERTKSATVQLQTVSDSYQILPPSTRAAEHYSQSLEYAVQLARDIEKRILRRRRIQLALGGSSVSAIELTPDESVIPDVRAILRYSRVEGDIYVVDPKKKTERYVEERVGMPFIVKVN